MIFEVMVCSEVKMIVGFESPPVTGCINIGHTSWSVAGGFFNCCCLAHALAVPEVLAVVFNGVCVSTVGLSLGRIHGEIARIGLVRIDARVQRAACEQDENEVIGFHSQVRSKSDLNCHKKKVVFLRVDNLAQCACLTGCRL